MRRLTCHLLFSTVLTAQSPCSLRGTVVDALNGQPLAGAHIFANSEDDSAPPVRRITDAQGTFCFEALNAGNYRIEAERARYLETNYGAKRSGGHGQLLEVGVREPLSPLVIMMTPQAVISGLLLDEDGDPLQGARISLLKHRWTGGRLETRSIQQTATDEQGRYRLAGLAAGTYFIRATSARDPRVPFEIKFLDQNGQPFRRLEDKTYYKDSPSFREAAPIQLRAGQELKGLTLTLARAETRHVSGHVSPELLNISPRRLFLIEEQESDASGMATSVPIQSDGSFIAEGLAPGRYRMIGPDVKEAVDLTSGDVEGLVLEAFKPVELQITLHVVGAPSDPTCALTRGLRLAPKTSDTDLANQTLDAAPTSGNKFRAIVLPGRYELGEVAEGPVCFIKNMLVDGVPQPRRNFEIKRVINSSIDLFLSADLASIDGRVAATQGELRSGVTILLQRGLEPDSWAEQPVAADGKFQWTLADPGKYRLYAFEDFDRQAWGNPQLTALFASQSLEVEIGEGDHLHEIVALISAEDFQEAVRKTDF